MLPITIYTKNYLFAHFVLLMYFMFHMSETWCNNSIIVKTEARFKKDKPVLSDAANFTVFFPTFIDFCKLCWTHLVDVKFSNYIKDVGLIFCELWNILDVVCTFFTCLCDGAATQIFSMNIFYLI